MSDQVENQIVSMQFDNKQFESGVATSMSTLDRLKNSLNFGNTGKGLTDLQIANSKLDLSNTDKQVSTISHHLNLMRTAGLVAFATIVRQATYAGERVLSAFTIDPIKAGFQNYETKINAVQTILSNTADQGTNLKQVTGVLGELNKYANLTVYNFSEMAKNIGTFTAAGVDLKTSVSSIKGIANLAALSGSSSEQASSAMYQLSQAIAAGQVHLQDWNSVVNAGIGGSVFQKNLIQTALATGTLDKSQVHLGKTMADTTVNGVAFRQSLTAPPGQKSWLTSDVLTKSLGTFTGDMTKAKLVAQGFTKEQAKAIVAQGERAVNAATQIKTFSQLFQALKEEVASAWSNVFEALFGNINQAKKFLSPLHNMLQNALTNPINEIAKALAGWRKAGGFDDLIQIFKNLGTIVGNLLYPFKVLFTAILPNAGHAGKGLEGFTKTLATITGWLAKATSVTRKFGVVLGPLKFAFGVIGKLAGAFLNALKPLLPVLRDIEGYVSGMFNQGMSMAGNVIAGLIAGLDPKELEAAVVKMANNIVIWIKDALGIHSPASTMIPVGTNIVLGIVSGIVAAAQYLIKGLQKIFIGLGQAVKYLATNVDWGAVVKAINEGLFIAIALAFRGFLKSFTGTIGEFKETIGKAGGVLDQLTSNLKTMQQKVKSEIIRNIAISVGILAASAFLLSKVDGKKLAVSLGAIAGMMTSLLGVMYALGSGGGKGKHIDNKSVARQTASLLGMSTALIAFSTSVLILVSAVALMGQLKPGTIKKGLAGVAGIIGIMVTTTAILSKTGGGATILATATAMSIMAGALVAFVGVMKLYEKLDWKTLVRGGGAAAAVIVAIGLAMRAFGKGAVGGSVGLIIASGALVILAKAMTELSKIGLGNMIKTVVALDLILGSLVVAANGMNAAEGGAGSMLVMAGAIIVLAQALKIISKIPLLDLAKAIGAITLAIIIIAGTSAALSELSPLVAALGGALLLVGGAIFLAGAGILAFATAMGIIAVVGPAAFAALKDGIDQFLEELPKIGKAIGGFAVSIVIGFVEAAGPLTKALGKLIGILIDVIIKLIPKIQNLIQRLVNAVLEVIAHSETKAYKVMIRFVLGLLDALNKAVPKFITKGSDLIIAVIQGLGKNAVRIANATGHAILEFLRGLDKAINKYEPQIIAEGLTIGKDLVKGLLKGIKDGIPDIGKAASGLAHKALDVIKSPTHWHIKSPSRAARALGARFSQGAAMGITDHVGDVERSSQELADTAFSALKMTFSRSHRAAGALGDIKPKITPVLDLSQLQKDATKIGGTLGSHTLSAAVSRRTAHDIASRGVTGGHTVVEEHNQYTFEQNNYSPKPINHVKAYRGTKSQIALFKEVTGNR